MQANINNKVVKTTKRLRRRIKKTNRKINRANRRAKIQYKRLIRTINRNNNNRISAAYPKMVAKEFDILKQTGTTMRVRGVDLIYKIPDIVDKTSKTSVIAVIPANPAYWLGTRMAAISAGYQNYRPLKFNISYVPQVAVTQQGNVLAGTLWSMSPSNENIQQTLRTSNGGMLTQCYNPATSTVQLKGNLQFNLFRMGGEFNQESNPFIFVAIAIATTDNENLKINPGYFYVHYEYELKNPIGDTIQYFNSGLITNSDAPKNYVNDALVYCATNNTKINVGAIIQKDEGYFTWNGKPAVIQNDDPVWYFSNDKLDLENHEDEEEQTLELKADKLTLITQQNITYANGETQWFVNVLGDGVTTIIAMTNETQSTATGAVTTIANTGSLYAIGEDYFNLLYEDGSFYVINSAQVAPVPITRVVSASRMNIILPA